MAIKLEPILLGILLVFPILLVFVKMSDGLYNKFARYVIFDDGTTYSVKYEDGHILSTSCPERTFWLRRAAAAGVDQPDEFLIFCDKIPKNKNFPCFSPLFLEKMSFLRIFNLHHFKTSPLIINQ